MNLLLSRSVRDYKRSLCAFPPTATRQLSLYTFILSINICHMNGNDNYFIGYIKSAARPSFGNLSRVRDFPLICVPDNAFCSFLLVSTPEKNEEFTISYGDYF